VPVPAYVAMLENSRLGRRITDILMKGVSTRKYKDILPEMAHTVGVSKSQVSRKFVEESEKQLKKLCERRFDDRDIIAVYVDGIQYGDCHVIVALGVDIDGHKHVLGIREGSSENSRVASDLLVDMVERGVRADRLRLFVIDGSKALRCAIDAVYGTDNPVQRCRNHKVRNVMDYPGYFTRFQWCRCGKCQTQLYSYTASAGFCRRCAAGDAPVRVNRRLWRVITHCKFEKQGK